MKRRPINKSQYVLGACILLLLIALAGAASLNTQPAGLTGTAAAIPLGTGDYAQAGDIQSASSGLQGAAKVQPAQLSQLQVSR